MMKFIKVLDERSGAVVAIACHSIVAVSPNNDDDTKTVVTFEIGDIFERIVVNQTFDNFMQAWRVDDLELDIIDLLGDQAEDED